MTTASSAHALQEVRIPIGRAWLYGDLGLPARSSGLVLFAHGSGSGRHSARNRAVARHLQDRGIATLLFDLLTAEEEQVELPLGFFGASTGSAAALIAAAQLGQRVAAVVSRGGRPDLAGPAALAALRAPTLLIVGGADHGVIELNEQALRQLRCESQLEIVPGATHLFEEPGTLEQVSELAAAWFTRHLQRAAHPA
jgi:pimeloyl-ACP methyl ester carboxylesterase